MAKAKTEIRSLARSHTKAALKTLAAISKNVEAPCAARVSAAVALLDRGWGKPAQALQVSGEDGGPIQVEERSPLEFVRRLAFALAKGADIREAIEAEVVEVEPRPALMLVEPEQP